MADKKKDFPLPNQIAWNGICRLQEAREVAKSKLVTAEDDLKNARAEMADAGNEDDKSEEFRDAASALVKCEAERDGWKRRLVELAKKIDESIVAACKGDAKLFDDLDATVFTKPLSAEERFGTKDEDPAQSKLPVGKPGKLKPEQPDPSKGDGVDEHLNAGVQELGLSGPAQAHLIKKGFTKIGMLVKVIDDDKRDSGVEFDVGDADLKKIMTAVKAYRKKHRSAMAEAEKID